MSQTSSTPVRRSPRRRTTRRNEASAKNSNPLDINETIIKLEDETKEVASKHLLGFKRRQTNATIAIASSRTTTETNFVSRNFTMRVTVNDELITEDGREKQTANNEAEDEEKKEEVVLPDFSMFAHHSPKVEEDDEASADEQSPGSRRRSPRNRKTSTPKNATKTTVSAKKAAVEQIIMNDEKLLKTPSPKKGRRTSSVGSNSSSSSRKKRQKIEPGSLTPPKDWEKTYTLVEELRADKTAPVDLVGAPALPETHLGPKVYRFQVLVSLLLSSQTKDAICGAAVRKLQKHGLTVENILETSEEKINELIYQVGFRNNKTKYLKQCCEILSKEYDGDIPPTADEMIQKLPGIGPKMAYIVESIAFNRTTGIGVDTHMHRLFPLLKWVNPKTANTPERTREELEGWLPRDKWDKINVLFVGFGQESQQEKEKILRKALACSQPREALLLLKRVGLDYVKEGKKFDLSGEIAQAMKKDEICLKDEDKQT